MKHNLSNLGKFTLFSVLLSITTIANAQTTAISSTSTTTSAGTVSDFSPDTIAVRTTTTSTPVNYSYTKTTTYVDENGNPVSSETVKSGLPVTVYYSQDGTRMTATKVVVHKTTTVDGAPAASSSTTTTTTSDGTVSQFGPDAIVVKTSSSTDPVSYSSTKTTSYVDENGNPVSSETVKSGQPVTVYYDQNGTKMIATKVIVRKTTTTTTSP